MIGILSDSHDNVIAIRSAVNLFKRLNCSLIIHAGDIIAPFAARELLALSCPVKAVFGNCDGERRGLEETLQPPGEIKPEPLAFSYLNFDFLVTHVPFSNSSYLASNRYDVLVFGHTHKPEVKREGKTLVINPGEAGGWLSGKSTAALLDPKTMKTEIIRL